MTHTIIIDDISYEGIKKVTLVTEGNLERIIFDDTKGVLSHDPRILAIVEKHSRACRKQFQEENPCPNCGSHDVDCDWGTPVWCNACKHEW